MTKATFSSGERIWRGVKLEYLSLVVVRNDGLRLEPKVYIVAVCPGDPADYGTRSADPSGGRARVVRRFAGQRGSDSAGGARGGAAELRHEFGAP